MSKCKLDRIIALDITAIFFDDKSFYPRKLHMTQIENATIYGLEDYMEQIKKCKSFTVHDGTAIPSSALCEVQRLNEPDIIDHLLEVIDSLSYTVACCKYPNHYSHEKDKEEILIDAGMRKEFRDEILK